MALEIVVLHLDEWIMLLLFYILDGSGVTIVMSFVIALDTIGEDLTELVALYTTSTSFCCATLKNPFFVVSVHLFLYQIIWKVALFTMYVGADLDAMGATTGGGHLVINSCNEIFGACLHKTKFHRFPPPKEHTDVKNTSTDEVDNPEKSTSTMAKLSS
jgi:hypothetical protein